MLTHAEMGGNSLTALLLHFSTAFLTGLGSKAITAGPREDSFDILDDPMLITRPYAIKRWGVMVLSSDSDTSSKMHDLK